MRLRSVRYRIRYTYSVCPNLLPGQPSRLPSFFLEVDFVYAYLCPTISGQARAHYGNDT